YRGVLFIHGRTGKEFAGEFNADDAEGVFSSEFAQGSFGRGLHEALMDRLTDEKAGEGLGFAQVVAHKPLGEISVCGNGNIIGVDIGWSDKYGGGRGYLKISGEDIMAVEEDQSDSDKQAKRDEYQARFAKKTDVTITDAGPGYIAADKLDPVAAARSFRTKGVARKDIALYLRVMRDGAKAEADGTLLDRVEEIILDDIVGSAGNIKQADINTLLDNVLKAWDSPDAPGAGMTPPRALHAPMLLLALASLGVTPLGMALNGRVNEFLGYFGLSFSWIAIIIITGLAAIALLPKLISLLFAGYHRLPADPVMPDDMAAKLRRTAGDSYYSGSRKITFGDRIGALEEFNRAAAIYWELADDDPEILEGHTDDLDMMNNMAAKIGNIINRIEAFDDTSEMKEALEIFTRGTRWFNNWIDYESVRERMRRRIESIDLEKPTLVRKILSILSYVIHAKYIWALAILPAAYLFEYITGTNLGPGKYLALAGMIPQRPETPPRPPTDEYKELIIKQREELIKKMVGQGLLPELFPAAIPETFVYDVLYGMPIEHIRVTDTGRLIDEIIYAAILTAYHTGEGADRKPRFYFSNPPDASHTELLIYRDTGGNFDEEIGEILKGIGAPAGKIRIVSTWGSSGIKPGYFYVFEISKKVVKYDKEHIVALDEEEAKQLKARLAGKGYEFIDCAGVLNGYPGLAERIESIKSEINDSIPKEVPAPSLVTRRIECLRVLRGEEPVDYRTFAAEDAFSGRETDRQRISIISQQENRLDKALKHALAVPDIQDDIRIGVNGIRQMAFKRLSENGKDVLFTFKNEMPGLKTRMPGRGEALERVLQEVEGFFASLEAIKDVGNEKRLVASVRNAFLANQRVNIENAPLGSRGKEQRSLSEAMMGLIEYQILKEDFESSLEEGGKRAYLKMLDDVKTFGEVFLAPAQKKIDAIMIRTELPMEERERLAKIHNATVQDAYGLYIEIARVMRAYSHPLPDELVESEKEAAGDAIFQVINRMEPLSTERFKRAAAFLAEFERGYLDKMVAPGRGMTASQAINDFALTYIAARPDAAEDVKLAAGIFTYLMEGRRIQNMTMDEQEVTFYIAEGMDQPHFNEIITRNPHLAGIGDPIGNSRSHWNIAARDMIIPGRAAGLITVSGSPGLKGLKTGDTIIVDGINRRIVTNPLSNPDVMGYYNYRMTRLTVLGGIFVLGAKEPARTNDADNADRQEVIFYSDIPSPGQAGMTGELGSAGVGLNRIEGEYMNKKMPSGHEIYSKILAAADRVEGRVTGRTLDMADDKFDDRR
ncbi:MAG: hypothetical protein PHT32_07345, partial [Candidatus Omnitrophica bacterium]|nr:hypothetical protein [Candidatus Omnitrophota bacterium]